MLTKDSSNPTNSIRYALLDRVDSFSMYKMLIYVNYIINNTSSITIPYYLWYLQHMLLLNKYDNLLTSLLDLADE